MAKTKKPSKSSRMRRDRRRKHRHWQVTIYYRDGEKFARVYIDRDRATRVLDVGCGSGPLFAPLASKGIHVKGIDPADAMVELARKQAEDFPGLVEVEQGGWEELEDVDGYDVAVALGVFDYVGQPAELLTRMGRAATHVVGSFPSPGLRLELRKARYGLRGVGVHGYRRSDLQRLAREAGLVVAEMFPLDRAGHVAHYARSSGGSGDSGGSRAEG